MTEQEYFENKELYPSLSESLHKLNAMCKARLDQTDKYYRRDLDAKLTNKQRKEIDEYCDAIRKMSVTMKKHYAETGEIVIPKFPFQPIWIK